MTEQLDSRVLRHTDTYGQRFMKPGTYRYSISAAGGSFSDDARYVIEVKDGDPSQMTQTLVTIAFKDGRFTPSEETVEIAAGDLVMWHSQDAESHPFAVHGEKEFFSSERLVNESGYTHAFLTPGDHAWGDAYGSDVGGVIRVAVPEVSSKSDFAEWQRQAGEGVLVMIADGRAEPAEVNIVVGQTVYFALTKGPGISITAKELLQDGKGRKGVIDTRLKGAAFFRVPA